MWGDAQMRRLDLLLVLGLVFVPSIVGAAPPAETKWVAVSECSKSVQGKSGAVTIKIGLSVIDLDRASCDSVGKSKATGMASTGWSCVGDDARQTTHFCMPIGKDEEELGLKNVRTRTPVMNTYLVFTDLTGHLTLLSFWEMPNAVGMKMCDAIRLGVVKSGVKDAQCVPGNTG